MDSQSEENAAEFSTSDSHVTEDASCCCIFVGNLTLHCQETDLTDLIKTVDSEVIA